MILLSSPPPPDFWGSRKRGVDLRRLCNDEGDEPMKRKRHPATKKGWEAKGDRQKSDQKRQKSDKMVTRLPKGDRNRKVTDPLLSPVFCSTVKAMKAMNSSERFMASLLANFLCSSFQELEGQSMTLTVSHSHPLNVHFLWLS